MPITSYTVILAQVSPGAAVETLLYQVPTTNRAFVEGITVCNRSAFGQSFRLSVSNLGAPTAVQDYIYFDLPTKGNDTFLVELDFTMKATDVLRVFASSPDLSFCLYGYLA